MALSLPKVVQFLNATEGKDKSLKFIQFGSRAFSDICRRFLSMPEQGKQFELLWRAILDARNIMWFQKSLNEYQTVQTLGKQAANAQTAHHRLIVNLTRACRFTFMIRWAIENFKMLGKIGFLKGVDGAPKGIWNVRAKWMWFFACSCGIAAELLKVQLNTNERAKLQSLPSCVSVEAWHRTDVPAPSNTSEKTERIAKLDVERTKSLKSVVAFMADGTIASHVISLPQVLGLWQGGFSDLTCGIAGVCSSSIQSSNLWPA